MTTKVAGKFRSAQAERMKALAAGVLAIVLVAVLVLRFSGGSDGEPSSPLANESAAETEPSEPSPDTGAGSEGTVTVARRPEEVLAEQWPLAIDFQQRIAPQPVANLAAVLAGQLVPPVVPELMVDPPAEDATVVQGETAANLGEQLQTVQVSALFRDRSGWAAWMGNRLVRVGDQLDEFHVVAGIDQQGLVVRRSPPSPPQKSPDAANAAQAAPR